MGVVYDAGALLAAERGDRRMWALHAGFLSEAVLPVVPSPVLVQVWRGGPRQANLSRALAACDVEPLTESAARSAGVLLGRSHRSDVTDAVVADRAFRHGDLVVTSDPEDIAHLAGALGAELVVEVV